jgi:hypothetical protein
MDKQSKCFCFPRMNNLSPAAQAVLDAYNSRWDNDLAAALRAAADQVVPVAEVAPQEDLESGREAMAWGLRQQTQLTRYQLLAIAAELEAFSDD